MATGGRTGRGDACSSSPAEILLRRPPLAGEPRQAPHPPPLHEELENGGVVPRRVHAHPLRHRREVSEQVAVAAVEHEMRRHGDLLPHHVRERLHRPVGVDIEELLHDLRVGRLVALLVGGDGAADLRQLCLSPLLGQPRRVAVGDEGRPLLEGRVDEAQVLDRLLDLAHVHSSGEVEVLVEEVAVAVLLRRPRPRPDGPGGAAGARLVADAVEGVEHRLVRRQRLLRDHVADEADENPSPAGSGRKSCGCQDLSTGFKRTSMFSSAHPSSDLKISTFCGGMECVTCAGTSRGGANGFFRFSSLVFFGFNRNNTDQKHGKKRRKEKRRW
ncbi:unnamed protein product [Spirodela intermedia]|uniref:Uncharacterized protein n=1 Tax=Spirodela intermedia TaxID=51605 RepID=A0A7I8K8C9_SPIIN|nr:unnamed protein product [Spirodela intermedia]